MAFALRQPWAIRLWKRLKVILFAYIVAIVLVAIFRLIFNFTDIYG